LIGSGPTGTRSRNGYSGWGAKTANNAILRWAQNCTGAEAKTANNTRRKWT